MKLEDNQVLEVCRQAGFKIFGNRIVAADNGSSGEATQCARKLVELVLELSEETELLEEDYPVPGNNWREQQAVLNALEKQTQNLEEGKVEGAMLRFSVADGYAYYFVKQEKPLQLQYIPVLDCYRVQAALIRGLTLDDVRELVKRERMLRNRL